MFISDRLNQRRFRAKLSGVSTAGQRRNADHATTMGFDKTCQIGYRAALPNEIIDDQVLRPGLDRTNSI